MISVCLRNYLLIALFLPKVLQSTIMSSALIQAAGGGESNLGRKIAERWVGFARGLKDVSSESQPGLFFGSLQVWNCCRREKVPVESSLS